MDVQGGHHGHQEKTPWPWHIKPLKLRTSDMFDYVSLNMYIYILFDFNITSTLTWDDS